MPKAAQQYTTSRRTLLASAALVAPTLALPAVALVAPVEPDPLPALERAFWRYYRWEDLPRPVDDDDPRIELYCDRWQETAAAIIATPAATAVGLRTKVRVLMLELTDGKSAHGEDLARSLLADLDRLAGEGRA